MKWRNGHPIFFYVDAVLQGVGGCHLSHAVSSHIRYAGWASRYEMSSYEIYSRDSNLYSVGAWWGFWASGRESQGVQQRSGAVYVR